MSAFFDDIRAKREGRRPKQCVICERKATGFHYQAPSCDSCKSFFRRAVLVKADYICRRDSRCNMGLCRACRYKKCIDSGMDPKSVFSQLQLKMKLSCQQSSPFVGCEQYHRLFQLSAWASNQINYLNRLDEQCAIIKRSGRLAIANSLKHLLSNFLNPNDSEPLLVHVSDEDASSFHEIFLTVEFAKHFDFFTHLAGTDQLNLLKSNSLCCSLFSYAFTKLLRELDTSPEEILTLRIRNAFGPGSMAEVIAEQSQAVMRRVCPDRNEFLLLRAIFLCDNARCSLNPTSAFVVERERMLIVQSLLEYCQHHHGKEAGASRFVNLVGLQASFLQIEHKFRRWHLLLMICNTESTWMDAHSFAVLQELLE